MMTTKRYEYKFVRVKVGVGLFGKFSKEYQQVIEQHAIEGWRFVQVHTPTVGGWSVMCDLIFERERG